MEIRTFEENRKIFIKKLIAAAVLILIVAIAVVLIVIGINRQKELEYLESYGMSAVSVGSNEVTYDIYRTLYLNYRDELKKSYTKDGETDTAALDSEIRTRVLNDLRYMYAIVSLGSEHGLSLTSRDVLSVSETYIEEMKAYCKESEIDFNATLEEGYMTERAFEFFQRVMAMRDVLYTTLVQNKIIESADENVLAALRGEDFIRVKSIFIENDAGEEVENNRLIAAEVIEKYNGGEEFNSLIGKYSEEIPGGEAYIMRGEKEAAFENAAFALADGEISNVVEVDGGFYIILRLEKDEMYIIEHFTELKSLYQHITFENKLKAKANMLTATESEYVRSLSYEEIK
ncbi:MAG: hypothetical protein E7598_00095 [Ruminococcaceae bacterium]|nr:hypothetical protein [Oscillospiraceae bacterium]